MMKKVLIISSFIFINSAIFAKTDCYEELMQNTINSYWKCKNSDSLRIIASQFERIAKVEKIKWIPFYYAVYFNVDASFRMKDDNERDELLEYSEKLLEIAFTLHPDSSECYVLKGYIQIGYLSVSPTRGATYSIKANNEFDKAIQSNPENPRAYYLKGITKSQTPAFWGGGCYVAIPILKKAMEKYETFKPKTALSPNWGKRQCARTLANCEKK